MRFRLTAWSAFAVAITVWLSLVSTGCEGDDGERTLHVYAASSLQDVAQTLASELEASSPGLDVVVTVAGTQRLRTQILHGAPADVFIAADVEHMDALAARGEVEDVRTLTCNELVVAVPRANPAGLEGFWDLDRAERIVLGTSEVPVGRYADAALDGARQLEGGTFTRDVRQAVVSRETNTRQVLSRVVMGEADAAMVYRTDALSAGEDTAAFEVPDGLAVTARYSIAIVSRSHQTEIAREFVDLALGERGQTLLAEHGFVTCPDE